MAHEVEIDFSGMSTLIVEGQQPHVRLLDMRQLAKARHQPTLVVPAFDRISAPEPDEAVTVPGTRFEYWLYHLKKFDVTVEPDVTTPFSMNSNGITMNQPPGGVGKPNDRESIKWVANLGELCGTTELATPSLAHIVRINRSGGHWTAAGAETDVSTFDFDPRPKTWLPKRYLAPRFKVRLAFKARFAIHIGRKEPVEIAPPPSSTDSLMSLSISNVCRCNPSKSPDFPEHYKHVKNPPKSPTIKAHIPSLKAVIPDAPEACRVAALFR